MPIAFYTFIVSGGILLSMIVIKMIMSDRQFHPWVRIRKHTDAYIHRSISNTSDLSQKVTHSGLRKLVSVIYHGIIPIVENVYRSIASTLYRVHRKAWSFLEYSKHSTHQVSEHLRHLSRDKAEPKPEQASETTRFGDSIDK